MMLILFSIPMIVAERISLGNRRTIDAKPRDSILIGLAQAVALIPGRIPLRHHDLCWND